MSWASGGVSPPAVLDGSGTKRRGRASSSYSSCTRSTGTGMLTKSLAIEASNVMSAYPYRRRLVTHPSHVNRTLHECSKHRLLLTHDHPRRQRGPGNASFADGTEGDSCRRRVGS